VSYYHDHTHINNLRSKFTNGDSRLTYSAVVGTIEQGSEKPITGRSGDHLQFYVNIGNGARYQADVNTQSSDGSEIEVFIADELLQESGDNPDEPFGAPAYGRFPNVQLSYLGLGLKDVDFAPMPYYRIEGQLRAALDTAVFVSIYGMTFDDGGPDGKGIHDTHLNPGQTNRDGAVVIYWLDSGVPKRSWYFFKFQNETINSQHAQQAAG
jgi:hypothetical protein